MLYAALGLFLKILVVALVVINNETRNMIPSVVPGRCLGPPSQPRGLVFRPCDSL